MRFLSLVLLALFSLLFGFTMSCSGDSPAKLRQSTLRPADLLSTPNNYLNRAVDIEIVEPLYGPSTPTALAALEYGQLEIRIPDAAGGQISLVTSAFKPDDPNRYRHKFDRVIESPLRVHGEFLRDDEMTQSIHRPVYVIRVSSMEPLDPGPAEPVHSLAEIKSNPARWDRKRIIYEGVYQSRFEVSALDQEIWLETMHNTTVIGRPADRTGNSRSDRVRVTGILFSKPGAGYGHLGAYGYQILASNLEYLGAAAP